MTDAVSSHCLVPSSRIVGLEDLVAAALGLRWELGGDRGVDVPHLFRRHAGARRGLSTARPFTGRDHDLARHPAVGMCQGTEQMNVSPCAGIVTSPVAVSWPRRR